MKIIYDTGYFRNLSFVGGTALRILYDLRRFSEDLDFSLFQKFHYDFHAFGKCLYQQTHPERSPVTENNFKQFLEKELRKIDFRKAQQDVARFLEDKQELRLFNLEVFLSAAVACKV